MLFKNLMMFRYNPVWQPDMTTIEDALEQGRFVPCSATQAQSVGWVAPRGNENDTLVEVINGQWLLRLMIEDKPVPASVIKRRITEMCDKVEQETGRRPGRKYQSDMKDEVMLELLPMAFPRQKAVNIWLNPKNNWVMLDVTGTKQADLVITALVKALDGLAVNELQTQTSPAVAMTEWLQGEEPTGWTVDMDCELRAEGDTMKSVLRYSGMSLDTPEIRTHLDQGMQPTQLAMTWGSRVSLVLTHEMKLKRISFLDVVFESNPNDQDDMFDADAAIATGELLPLLEGLVHALGGKQESAF